MNPPACILTGTENSPLSFADSDHIHSPLTPPDQEPVHTLFVSGLPTDVKNREVYNLFRTFNGFQSSTISYTGERKMPVSFVVFSDQESALAAREILQGINFDPEIPTPLRIELARTNSKVKPRKKETPRALIDPSNGTAPMRTPRRNDPLYSTHMQDIFPESNTFSYFPERSNQFVSQSPPRSPSQHTPCSTLFIGNISPVTSETALQTTFSKFHGFEKLKISQKGDCLMCFIDFANVPSSNSAMNALRKMNIPAAEGRRIRIEFARNRMKAPTWS